MEIIYENVDIFTIAETKLDGSFPTSQFELEGYYSSFHLDHGTIIRTGITCKKIPCYMRDSACRWLIVENAKIFRSYVKHF